jgi:hypothetical protein
MAVRFSALRPGHPLTPGRFLVLIPDRGCLDPRAIVQLEELAQLKNPVTSLGFKPATFRAVAYCLNQLRYRVHLFLFIYLFIYSPVATRTQSRITKTNIEKSLNTCCNESFHTSSLCEHNESWRQILFLADPPTSRINFYFYFFNFGLWGYWHCGHSWPIVPASGENNYEDEDFSLLGYNAV